LPDGTIGIDNDEGARQEAHSLDTARLAENELDELAEEPDVRFLSRGRVPAVEDADQPVGVAATGRRATPVGVRQ
jgi:hypothetical protein